MLKQCRRLLVANRGEIAVRIMRTAREMGIQTVAVYTDADQDALHTKTADIAYYIGESVSTHSYLNIPRIIEAAKTVGADAIHPGYGFLSEQADFAQACEDAGIIFVGPLAESIAQMGSKQAAKALAERAGVPVVPGYQGKDQSVERLIKEAEKIGTPLLIKASAGGGGKGMRRVDDIRKIHEAIADARSESQRAFGDDTVLLERYVDRPRHIEIQVLADEHGNAIHLGERECSIQRRYQKVLEESPSPFVDSDLRARMGADAVKLVQQIGYVNAGTIEFIMDEFGHYYFLEMNTRLQVEHPVTEEVYGIDLVRAQLEVAMGAPLSIRQEDVKPQRAAVEVRLYAEDPANDFFPENGQIWHWHVPQMAGLRVDTGVMQGSEISTYYDPMIAKIIAIAPTRVEAGRRLAQGLRDLQIAGVRTNKRFLIDLVEDPDWQRGDTHTHFIPEHYKDGWIPSPQDAPASEAALAATIAGFDQRMQQRDHLPALRGAFRTNVFAPQVVMYTSDDQELSVYYRPLDSNYSPERGAFEVFQFEDLLPDGQCPRGDTDAQSSRTWRYTVTPTTHGQHVILRAPSGLTRRWHVASEPHSQDDVVDYYAHTASSSYVLQTVPRFPLPEKEVLPGSCMAPMSGTVLHLMVAQGDKVTAGQTLMVLEAMKMEHRVSAPEDGIVAALHVEQGAVVHAGVVLAVVEAES